MDGPSSVDGGKHVGQFDERRGARARGGADKPFTVFSGPGGPHAVLTGLHWFERPYPHRGPAFGAVHGEVAAKLAARRHEEAWERAHDVGPAVWNILSKARRAKVAR